jgi:hypothetical protein
MKKEGRPVTITVELSDTKQSGLRVRVSGSTGKAAWSWRVSLAWGSFMIWYPYRNAGEGRMVDRYTKIVLTVIAAALVLNVVQDFLPDAHAQKILPAHFEEEHTYRSLPRNRTFQRAVEYVVEDCEVDGEEISC